MALTLNTKVSRVAGNLVVSDASITPTSSLWDTCPLAAIAADPLAASVYHNDFHQFTSGEEMHLLHKESFLDKHEIYQAEIQEATILLPDLVRRAPVYQIASFVHRCQTA